MIIRSDKLYRDERIDKDDQGETARVLVTYQHMHRNVRCGLAYV
jgi:hypothetical protein